MTIDNCLEALLPLENNKKRKMRNRMKKKKSLMIKQIKKKPQIGKYVVNCHATIVN